MLLLNTSFKGRTPGDFLFSRANTIELVGACLIAGEFKRNLLLSDKILRFRFSVQIDRWVDMTLKTRLGRNQIQSLSTGNQHSMRNIGQERIRRIAIPLPPLAEADRILGTCDEELIKILNLGSLVTDGRKHSRALKQSILRSAFRGKLVSQDPNDESASVLLERIAAERAAAEPKRPGAAGKRGPHRSTKATDVR